VSELRAGYPHRVTGRFSELFSRLGVFCAIRPEAFSQRAARALLGLAVVGGVLAGCQQRLPAPRPGDRAAAEEALERGWAAHEAGDWRTAEHAYLEAVDLDPSYAWSYYRLGVLAATTIRWGTAEAYFWRAIQADPEFMPPYYEIGVRRAATGDFTGATELLGRAVQLAPADPYARLQLGRTYEAQGKLAEAADQFAAARDIDPDADAILGALPPLQPR